MRRQPEVSVKPPRCYCLRCDRPIRDDEPTVQVGFRDKCIACVLRPNVMVNAAIRLRDEKLRQVSEPLDPNPAPPPAPVSPRRDWRAEKRRRAAERLEDQRRFWQVAAEGTCGPDKVSG